MGNTKHSSGGSGGGEGGGDNGDTDTDTTSRTPLFYVSSFVCLLYTLLLASWAYGYNDLPSAVSSICASSLSYIMAVPSAVNSSLSYVMDRSAFLCKMFAIYNIFWMARDASHFIDLTYPITIITHLIMSPLYIIGFIYDISKGVTRITSNNPLYSFVLMSNMIYHFPTAYAHSTNNVAVTNYKLVIVILVLLIGFAGASGKPSSLLPTSDSDRSRGSGINNENDQEQTSLLGNRKQRENPPGSADLKKDDGHHAPTGKQPKTTFLYRHLIQRKRLPLLDQCSNVNKHLTTMIAGLTPTVTALKAIASKIAKKFNAKFCHASCNSTNINDTEILIIGNFPPSGYEHHAFGILSTMAIVGYNFVTRKPIKESLSTPVNCSIHQFYLSFATIMSIEYNINPVAAMIICIQISVWVDILPISLPSKSADDESESSLYNKTRRKTDELSKAYIHRLIQNLKPHLKCLIILGHEAYELVQEMKKDGLIPDDIEIIQHSPIAHPTKILKYGLSKREAHWFYDCITKTLAYLVNVPSEPESKEARRDKVKILFPDRKPDSVEGCFIYKAFVGDTLLFITRSYDELVKLVRKNKGSIPDSFKHEDIRTSGTYNYRGLDLKMFWFDDHDYSEGFGVIDEEGMKQWVKDSKKLRDRGWASKAQKGVSKGRSGFMGRMMGNKNN